jgi:hypothetical protein
MTLPRIASTTQFNAQALLKGLWATGRNRQTETFLKKLNVKPELIWDVSKPQTLTNPQGRVTSPLNSQPLKVIPEVKKDLTGITQGTRVSQAINPMTLEQAERPTIKLATQKGTSFDWKPSDEEWSDMSVAEKINYQTNPEQWLQDKPKWEKQRAILSQIEEVARIFGVNPQTDLYDVANVSPEATKAQLFGAGSAALNILPVPEIKPAARLAMKGLDYAIPGLSEGLGKAISKLDQTSVIQSLKKLANTPIGQNITSPALQRGSLRLGGEAAGGGEDIISRFINTSTEQIVTPLRDTDLINEIAKRTGFSRDFVETAPVETLQKALRPVTEGTGAPVFKPVPEEVRKAMGTRPTEAVKPTTGQITQPVVNEASQVAKNAPVTGKGNIPPVEPPKPSITAATPENADQFIKTFSEQLKGSKTQWDAVSQARTEIRAARAASFRAELEKATSSGLNAEQAYNQAIKNMAGKLPTGKKTIGDLIPESARPSLEAKIQQVLAGDDFEIMSTTTAFRNALVNDAIPRIKGTKGLSAYDRLVKVFGEDFVNGLEKGIKALPDNKYPPLDQAMMDYLRNLKDKGNQLSLLPASKRIDIAKKLQKIGVNIVDVLNIPRSIQSGYDFSMPFRQGLVAGVRHPIAWAKSWGPGLKAMRSESIAEGIMSEIVKDPDVAWGINKGYLDIPTFEKGAPYMKRLESFASNFAENIPGVRMSQRGATTFIAKLESDIWKSGVKQLRKIGADESEFKAFGQFITEAVGRGEIPKNLQKFTPVFNLLYSPRLFSSRILLPTRLFSSSAFVRKEAWSTLASLLAFGGTVLGIYKMLGGKVETDPRSADFGKMVIGKTRVDIWGGYLQYIRLASRLITGETKTTTGKVKPQSVSTTLSQFLRSKESPAVGLVADIMSGQTYSGDKIKPDLATLKTLAYENLTPLAIQDMIDAINEEGLPGGLVALPSTVGMGITTYTTGEERNAVKQAIGKLGQTDTEGLNEALKNITNPDKMAEIRAKDWTYDVKALFSDIRENTDNVDPAQLNEKGGFDPVVEYYWNYKKLDDEYNLISDNQKKEYVKSNPDYVVGKYLTGSWTNLKENGSLEIANQVESLANKYNIPLELIPAFQKDSDGTEKIPSDKNLWKSYFEYNDLPSSSYLAMSKTQVDNGELPDKYLKDWQTYQGLKTDSAKTAFRKSHPEASKTSWRTDYRKANPAIDKWLQEQEGMKPLQASKTTTGGTSRRVSTTSGRASGMSFSGSTPSRNTVALRKMPKARLITSIRAPSAPRI